MAKTELNFQDIDASRALFGAQNSNLQALEKSLDLSIFAHHTNLTLEGSEYDVDLGVDLLKQLYGLTRRGYPLFPTDIQNAVKQLSRDRNIQLKKIFLDTVLISTDRKVIAPRTFNQKLYIDAIRAHNLTFGIGAAGTGKTYLAMAMALSALSSRKVKRIVLARPAVDAGEKLGFLPGDLAAKVDPYLRPLYDALHDMVSQERAAKWIEEGIIEIAPLAFMRGRTLSDAFVILDEGQNVTIPQMKMFLTRLGTGTTAVVTGDITQTDLPGYHHSGLEHAAHVLRDIEGIAFCRFTDIDVVRHPLVQKIILAYEKYDDAK